MDKYRLLLHSDEQHYLKLKDLIDFGFSNLYDLEWEENYSKANEKILTNKFDLILLDSESYKGTEEQITYLDKVNHITPSVLVNLSENSMDGKAVEENKLKQIDLRGSDAGFVHKQLQEVIIKKKEIDQLQSLFDIRIMDNVGSCVFVITNEGEIEYCNKLAKEYINANKSRKLILDYLDDHDWVDLIDSVDGQGNAEHEFDELYFKKANSGRVKVDGSIRKINDSNVLIFAPSSRRDRLETAMIDQLTGLPNRQFLYRTLPQVVGKCEREQRSLALLMIDIEKFKQLNDSYANNIGDNLLRFFTRRLQKTIRKSDILTRYGGDEFVLVIDNDADARSAALVAQKIIDAMSESFRIGKHELYVSVNIGIAIYPTAAMDSDTLVKCAETALLSAKNDPKRPYLFYSMNHNKEIKERFSLEMDLRFSIIRNEMELYFQPKLSVEDQKVIGAEGLLRWSHHKRGPVSPMDFIPIAEDTGYIHELGRWVVEQACKKIKSWLKLGVIDEDTFLLSVNISVKQLANPMFAQEIREIITSNEVNPSMLELELTESCIMEDPNRVIEVLTDLSEFGLKLSVDDFGTGYSSLSYLSRFPLNCLKIDRSFIIEIFNKDQNMIITKSIIKLAHSLGLKVVAEGVETNEHLDFLKHEKCDQAQGYLFSKPISDQDFLQYLENHKKTRD